MFHIESSAPESIWGGTFSIDFLIHFIYILSMPTKKDSTKATFKHIDQVFENLSFFSTELLTRGHMHDRSKLLPPEKEGFDQNTCQLKTMVYGSPEYKESRKRMKPTLDHHYANNDHHPEHYAKVDEMNLFALVEMFCDWCASVKRNKDGDIFKSLEINKKRFKLSKQMYSILKNTAVIYRNKKLTK